MTVEKCECSLINLEPQRDWTFVLCKPAHACFYLAHVKVFDLVHNISFCEEADVAARHLFSLVKCILLFSVKEASKLIHRVQSISYHCLPLLYLFFTTPCEEVTYHWNYCSFDYFLEADDHDVWKLSLFSILEDWNEKLIIIGCDTAHV